MVGGQNNKTGANSLGSNDIEMGNIGTVRGSNPVATHGIFNNNEEKQ